MLPSKDFFLTDSYWQPAFSFNSLISVYKLLFFAFMLLHFFLLSYSSSPIFNIISRKWFNHFETLFSSSQIMSKHSIALFIIDFVDFLLYNALWSFSVIFSFVCFFFVDVLWFLSSFWTPLKVLFFGVERPESNSFFFPLSWYGILLKVWEGSKDGIFDFDLEWCRFFFDDFDILVRGIWWEEDGWFSSFALIVFL